MATWPGIVLASWDAFVGHVAQLGTPTATEPHFLFRGQGNASWGLQPRLTRLLAGTVNEDAAQKLEKRLMRHFEARSHHYLSAGYLGALADADPLERWAAMQHYGAPTRLLDWTESPFVAAYFACVTEREHDGVIFIATPGNVCVANNFPPGDDVDLTFAQLSAMDPSKTQVLFKNSTFLTEREISQKGHFSFAPRVLSAHDEGILRSLVPGSQGDGPGLRAARWVISRDKKIEFLRHLGLMNIGAHSLFPGLDGLGRSIEEIALVDASRI